MLDEQMAVVPQEEITTPANFNPEKQIEEGKRAAKALMEITKPVLIQGKKYLRFEDWQTLGKFYNLTVGVEWTKRINENNEEGFGARAVVYHHGKVISAAEAQCMRAEYNWRDRDDFALRSMCQTRACAKALRNVLSWVAVLAGAEPTPAEEMSDEPSPQTLTRSEPKPMFVVKDPDALATKAQLGLLGVLLVKHGKTLHYFNTTQETLTKGRASEIISELMAYQKQNPAEFAEHMEAVGDREPRE